ncbi:MAG TPA: tetratricopeptide repeat protein [Candidatus Obscuribacterales bacterium]
MAIAAIIFVGWLIGVCLHEFGHAVVAYIGGDKSVKDKGYLTLNLLKYSDPQVTFVLPIIILILGGVPLPGAAVYIDHRRLRGPLWEMLVAAAGPLATALVAILFSLPFSLHLPLPFADILMPGLAFLVVLQFVALVFNLLPLPGFDGFGIIEPWLPTHLRVKALQYGQMGILLALGIIWLVPPVNAFFWISAHALSGALRVPEEWAVAGETMFFAANNRYWLVLGLVALMILSRKKQTKQPTAEEFYRTARDRLAENRPDQALQAVNFALKLNNNIAEAWHLRAICLGLLNQPSEALEAFDVALRLKPDYADCWYNRACCLSLQDHNEEALASLQHALQLNPSDELKQHARKDIGFRALHSDQRFRQLTQSQQSQD